jgi:hypothetical protein
VPIIFVHGVASRLKEDHGDHDKVWETIKENLRKYIAPKISEYPDRVMIEEAYWGKLGVPVVEKSLPDDKRVVEIFQAKGSWLRRRLRDNDIGPDFLPTLVKRSNDLLGYFLTRVVDQARKPINKQVTLFLGDVFTYLDKRGTPKEPGEITKQLLDKLKKAHDNKNEKGGEPIVVLSHSMGGQLVYDAVSYYLPEMSKMPEYESEGYSDIRIDFWCAAASQVGLFREMNLFHTDIESASQSSKKISFPDKHLKIWWNLWDANDYLSFTAEPFFEDVLDDLYDSGQSFAKAHISHFDQTDFYKEFSLMLKEAKDADWHRDKFLKRVRG